MCSSSTQPQQQQIIMAMAKRSVSILLEAGVLSDWEGGKSFDIHHTLQDPLVHTPYLVLIWALTPHCSPPPPVMREKRDPGSERGRNLRAQTAVLHRLPRRPLTARLPLSVRAVCLYENTTH